MNFKKFVKRTAARPWARWLLLWVSYPPLHSLPILSVCLAWNAAAIQHMAMRLGGWVRGQSLQSVCVLTLIALRGRRTIALSDWSSPSSWSIDNRQFSLTRVEKYFSRTREKFSRLVNIATSYVKSFESYHLTYRQTDTTEIVYHTALQVVSYYVELFWTWGVACLQGDCRTYSYVAGISSDAKSPNWDHLYTLARIIPRVCTNINRCASTEWMNEWHWIA